MIFTIIWIGINGLIPVSYSIYIYIYTYIYVDRYSIHLSGSYNIFHAGLEHRLPRCCGMVRELACAPFGELSFVRLPPLGLVSCSFCICIYRFWFVLGMLCVLFVCSCTIITYRYLCLARPPFFWNRS